MEQNKTVDMSYEVKTNFEIMKMIKDFFENMTCETIEMKYQPYNFIWRYKKDETKIIRMSKADIK